jgi:hypothetical protein
MTSILDAGGGRRAGSDHAADGDRWPQPSRARRYREYRADDRAHWLNAPHAIGSQICGQNVWAITIP